MSFLTKEKRFIILQVTCVVIFAGRAWQHLFWDAPFRSILWDQALLEDFVLRHLEMDWNEYATDVRIDNNIQRFIQCTGVLFALSAISVFTIKKYIKLSTGIITLGIFILMLTAFASFKTKFFQIGEWLEFGTQIFSPVIYLLLIHKILSHKKLITLAKIAISITFIGHGFYAFGYYPQPGNYVDMVINITGSQEDLVRAFLRLVGALDFTAAILIFIPNTNKPALVYCIFWGFLTAAARIVSLFDFDFALQTLHQSLHLTVYRLSHSLLPLWVLVETLRMNTNYDSSKK